MRKKSLLAISVVLLLAAGVAATSVSSAAAPERLPAAHLAQALSRSGKPQPPPQPRPPPRPSTPRGWSSRSG